MFAFLTEEGFMQNLNDKLFIYLNRQNELLRSNHGMRLYKRAHSRNKAFKSHDD